MAKFYFDDDADLSVFESESVTVIGYGNQGRSQALNLKDSGVNVILGNIEDEYAERARMEGWQVHSIPKATALGDMVVLLIPDEVQAEVYERDMRDNLKDGALLAFAHGYNIFYRCIEPVPHIDVVLVAPRMLGRGVRETFLSGVGFPSFVAVHQDYTGRAHDRMLALAKGIGSTKTGVLMSTFEEETVIDLFSEHQPALYGLRVEYEVLVEAGYSPEAILLDLYASGEGIEWAKGAVDLGLFERMKLASPTAQFGHQVWALKYFDAEGTRERMREILEHIRNGDFAREWHAEEAAGFPRLKRVWQMNREHPISREERNLYKILGRLARVEEE